MWDEWEDGWYKEDDEDYEPDVCEDGVAIDA